LLKKLQGDLMQAQGFPQRRVKTQQAAAAGLEKCATQGIAIHGTNGLVECRSAEGCRFKAAANGKFFCMQLLLGDPAGRGSCGRRQ